MTENIMNFGKYKGKQITLVPTSYLIWAVKNVFDSFDSDLEKSIYKELVNRYEYELKRADYSDVYDDLVDDLVSESDLY